MDAWAPAKKSLLTLSLDKSLIKLWINGTIKSPLFPRLNLTTLKCPLDPSTTLQVEIGATTV